MTHAAFWTGHYTDDWAGRLHGRWEIGVTIFFVLSAFLLSSAWIKRAGERVDGVPMAAPSLKRYFWHRVKRILPAYWITVTVAYLIHRNDNPPPSGGGLEGWLRTMTFTQSLEFGWFHPGLSQMWSMVIEVGFYIALPVFGVIIWAVNRGQWRPYLTLALAVLFGLIGPIWTILSHQDGTLPVMARLWPMAFFDWFAVGIVLAIGRRQGWHINLWISWALALAFFFVATTPLAGPATLVPEDIDQALWKTVLYAAVGGFLIAPLALGTEVKALRHPALVWLGEISYEFFLVHVMIMDWAMGELGYQVFQGSMLAILIVSTVISIPVAWLLRRITDIITRHSAPASPWARTV